MRAMLEARDGLHSLTPFPGAYVREEEEDARHRSYLQQLRGLERQALHARVAADLAGMRAPRAAPHTRVGQGRLRIQAVG